MFLFIDLHLHLRHDVHCIASNTLHIAQNNGAIYDRRVSHVAVVGYLKCKCSAIYSKGDGIIIEVERRRFSARCVVLDISLHTTLQIETTKRRSVLGKGECKMFKSTLSRYSQCSEDFDSNISLPPKVCSSIILQGQ